VLVSGQRIGSRTVFWAAGVMASPAAQWLKTEADAAGRLKVGPELTVPGLPNVFAVGDTALSEAWDGKPVPGLAPAAKQQGAYVAASSRPAWKAVPACRRSVTVTWAISPPLAGRRRSWISARSG
jgi:putative oxidoreductase